MGRYLESKCKLCRREGEKLFLKGTRCSTEKCSFVKRPVPPGPRAKKSSGKASYYAMQLREKQKTKRAYGMLEAQFKRFFRIATKSRGVTGRTLIQLLESRLDNILYKSLLTLSRNQARQIVRHGFAFVDGKRVDIPSYLVKADQVIEIKGKDSIKNLMKENLEISTKERSVPTWLELNKDSFSIKVIRLPEKEDVTMPINEQFIVELYSK